MTIPNLYKHYQQKVVPEMKKRFGYKNDLAVPRVMKVIVNCGIGRLVTGTQNPQENLIPQLKEDIALITGQRPAQRPAKKSVSGFKLRKGMPVGLAVTLRGKKMYDFLSRLINIALPRTRDFKGISTNSFDKRGNLNIGLKEDTVFPELNLEKLKNVVGLGITVTTNAKNREEAIELFKLLGFPIKQ